MNNSIETFLIDADDTLWESGKYFIEAERLFLELVCSYDIEFKNAEETLHKRDVERLSIAGFGAKPFYETLEIVFNELVGAPDKKAEQQLNKINKLLLKHPMLLIDGVEATLKKLKAKNKRIFIYTKGEYTHQEYKIKESGLLKYFDDYIIVADKNTDILKALFKKYDIVPAESAVIGDSLLSDIMPAVKLGLTGFFVPHEHTWYIEKKDIDEKNFYVLKSITELLEYIE